MRPRVFLIGDTSDRGNWGCRATTAALRSLIGERAEITRTLDLVRLYEPIGSVVTPRERKPLPERARNRIIHLSDPLRRPLQRLLPSIVAGLDAASFDQMAKDIGSRKILRHVHDSIAEADVVVVNGEGAILGDRVTGRLCLLLAYTARVAMGTPTILVNHTADLRHPVMAAMAGRVYPVLDDVVVRDPLSLMTAHKYRGRRPLAMGGDAAFIFGGGRPADGTICVGGSAGYNVPTRDDGVMEEVFGRLCRSLGELGPVCVTAASRPDDGFLEPVAAALNASYAGLETTVEEASRILGSASVYVGGRWHPSILAARGGTPIVAFSSNSDYKSRGILELLELRQPAIAASEVGQNVDLMVALARDRLAEGIRLRDRLAERAQALAASAQTNVRFLEDL